MPNAFFIINWFTAFISLATACYLVPLVPNLMSSLDAGIQELRRLNEESEESRRKLVTFMAFLCHEIRNPLFAVTSFCAFLEDEHLLPNQERALASIQQSTHLMVRLVNDVLDISKLESGRLELEEKEFDLRELLESVGTSTEMQLRQKPSVQYKCHIAPNVPSVALGDSARILQIAYNLLSNAAKFTDEGVIEFTASMVCFDEALKKNWINTNADKGVNKLVFDGDKPTDSSETTFASTHDDESALRLLSAEEGTSGTSVEAANVCVLKIEVSDTGCGISHGLLERIFVPYSWSKLTEYRVHGGTGLGLAILSKLARKMGGTIHVASTEAIGSKFTIYIQLHVLPELQTLHFKESLEVGADQTTFSPAALCKTQATVAIEDRPREAVKESTSLLDASFDTAYGRLIIADKPVVNSAAHKRKPSLDLFNIDSQVNKVLIVDDNHVNRKLLARMMSNFNLEYELAEDGQQAVDIMMKSRNVTKLPNATHFGMILMDLSMPILDGCQATRILRACKLDIPILALTACAVDASKQDAIEAGVTEFLTKPILREHLHQKCTYYLLGEGSSEVAMV
ncbi:hypothetical protein MPSEU_001016200 [Mayamaea pseudoterrestris]|nr:hypothetical protein MPSEU_001016200 [Mayamaea pseudoterrestris]